jgi:hypothetical protein
MHRITPTRLLESGFPFLYRLEHFLRRSDDGRHSQASAIDDQAQFKTERMAPLFARRDERLVALLLRQAEDVRLALGFGVPELS